MIETIRKIDNWDTLTAAEIHDAFAAIVQSPNTHAWTMGDLVTKLGPTKTITIANALESSTNPIMRSAFTAISTVGGLTLHQPTRQGMVALLGLTPELTAEVQALGVLSQTWWERNAAGNLPTVEAIQAALDAERLRARIVNVAALLNERLSPSQSSDDQDAIVANAWQDAGA